ncbi:hypothetical protein K502DRAFT_101362 [Neoconidiobolus thromboides FSU 785]|nr:hypothetical protein K502DRAFT_101362 [Neoconidiobolus thromboides FSU 785]
MPKFHFIENLNDKISTSFIGRYFKLRGSGRSGSRDTTFSTEILAGLTTFVTMTYIIAVNSLIVADSGGTCVCNAVEGAVGPAAICVGDPIYEACQYTIKKDIVTATCVVSGISSILMGLVANLPIGLSSGMGLNAYFVYNVVGFHGVGGSGISYQTALAAVFIEGLIFILLTVLGVRQWIVKLLPQSLKHSMCAGIGLFLTFIGLQSSAGIGLIGHSAATLVTLGGCPTDKIDPVTQQCLSNTMESPTLWMGIFGLIIIANLTMFRCKGAMLYGILLVSIISWFRNTTVTYFPDTVKGNEMYDFFKQVVGFHSIEKTLGALDFSMSHGNIWLALVTFLYVDILEATGNIFALADLAKITDEEGNIEGGTLAFLCDAISISIGAVFGVPPVTAFLESGVGIAEGGKTGITAIVIGIMFFLSTFLAPIFASFPPWATGPALIVVGSLMCQNLTKVPWEHPGEAIPAFLTVAIMPFTYSIAYGLLAGIFSYIAFNLLAFIIEKISFGKLKATRPPPRPISEATTFSLSQLAPPWVPAVTKRYRQWSNNTTPTPSEVIIEKQDDNEVWK